MNTALDLGGLALAAILLSILLLPISLLFLSPVVRNDAVTMEGPENVTKGPKSTTNQTNVASRSALEDDDSKTSTTTATENSDDDSSRHWRCACEGGFLPPGLLGNMESVLKMGAGQCYHKSGVA